MIDLIIAAFVVLIHVFFVVAFQYSLNAYDIYYFTVASLLGLIFLVKIIRELKGNQLRIDWYEVSIFITVLVAGLIVIDVRSIWIDEYSQYQGANPISHYYSLSNAAALEQQPPLGYVVTSFFSNILGKNVFGLRLYSILFMALSCVFIKRILGLFRVPLLITCLAIIYFLTRSTIFSFLTEGKPYAIALFFSLWCLYYYLDFLENEDKFSPLKLIYILFFLVCSIGLQSGVFAVALFSAYALLNQKRLALNIFWINLVAALLFVPVFLNIVYWSESMSQFNDSLSLAFFIENFRVLSSRYWLLLLGYGPHVTELLILLTLFVASLLKKQRRYHFILLCLIIFYFFFIVSFIAFINWSLLLKYFVVVLPVLIIALALGANYLYQSLFVIRNRYTTVWILVLVAANAIPGGIYFDREVDLMLDNRGMPWISIYRFFNRSLSDHDTVYFLTFNEPGEWSMVKPVASEFYMKKNLDQFIGEKFIPNNNLTLPNYSKSEQLAGDIYLVSPIYWSNDHIDDDDLLATFINLEIKYIDGIRVFKLKANQHTKNERLITFYQHIIDKYSEFSWTFTARLSLIYLYSIEKRYHEQDRELEKLLAFQWPTRRSLAGMVIDRSQEVMNLQPFLSRRF